MFGYLEYAMSAMETEIKLNTWFGIRVAEVDLLYRWPGTSNLTYIAAKGWGVHKDMQADGVRQKGPLEARYPRDTWPASTREYLRKKTSPH